MSVILLVGGARSGKSATALEIARQQSEPVTFLATGEGRDSEMATRIARHRAERPESWTTIEVPIDVMGALKNVSTSDCVIIDCLTLWVSNCLEVTSTGDVERRAGELADFAANRSGVTIVVSNEVGLGVVPEHQLARAYVDVLGRVNSLWSNVARTMLFMIAGRAIEVPPRGTNYGPFLER
jgi:adenosyl cobinamide kinase/adenosyl cobinamide phosphate guanylyltransferase